MQRREHQLPFFAVGQRLHGSRVHNLHDEAVFPDVHAVLFGALEGHAGAAHLGQPVGIEGAQTVSVFDAPAHVLGMRLRPDKGDAQAGVDARVQAHLLEDAQQVEGVGWDDVHHGGAEILHQLDMAAAVAGSGGDGQRADQLGPVVETQPAGEKPVAHHVLEDVRTPDPGHVHAPCHQFRPGGDVFPGVVDDHCLPGGPGGGVDADDVVQGHGEKVGGGRVPQGLLHQEGDAAQVVEAGYLPRVDSFFPEYLRVISRPARSSPW